MAQSQSGEPAWEAWRAVSKRFSASAQKAPTLILSGDAPANVRLRLGNGELAQNLLHVAEGLRNLGHPAALLHAVGSRIVSAQRQRRVAAKTRQQLLQEAGAGDRFSAGSKGSRTPNSWAVAGINCISPMAPFCETAQDRKPDSWRATARSRLASNPSCCAACWISGGQFDLRQRIAFRAQSRPG